MAVISTQSRISYTADGILTAFAYPFEIFLTTDLQVYDNGVLKTLTSDYTVSGAGTATGGNVTFLVAPLAGHTIILVRVLPKTQLSQLPANDKFPSTTVETALDKITLLLQQLDEVDGRSLKLAVTSLFTNLSVPDPVVGKFLRWASSAALENADIATVGSLGLPVSTANGGTGLSAVGNEGEQPTSVSGALAYRPSGLVRITNKSGGSLTAGTVVVAATANDQAFNATTVVGSPLPVFVLYETIANNATGYAYQRGVVAAVNVQGNVTRYDHLRTSATSGRAESAGASKVTGAFAMALSTYSGGAAGTVIAILYGDTYVAASVAAYGDAPARDNLLIIYATASTLTITADGVKMLDVNGVSRIKRGLSVTADITTNALNGRDTATAESATKWYWIWAVSNGSTDGILLVPDTGGATPNAPSTGTYAWVYKLLIGAVFNDGSSNFRPFRQRNLRIDYTGDTTNGPPNVFTATNGQTSFTSVDISAFIPGSWVKTLRGIAGTSITTPTCGWGISPNSAGEYEAIFNVYNASAITTLHGWFCAMPWEIQWISAQTMWWRTTLTTAVAMRLAIRGFDLID